MSSTWIQPPATTPGPETVGVPSGPKLATLRQRGHGADGRRCAVPGRRAACRPRPHPSDDLRERQGPGDPLRHRHPRLPGRPTPGGPFVETGSCFYWLHVHADDGIIHIESPSTTQGFTLGQFFAEWGIPLSTTQVGPATGPVTVFFTSPGKKAGLYTGNPNNLPLGDHYQIQLDVGTPIVAPVKVPTGAGCRLRCGAEPVRRRRRAP